MELVMVEPQRFGKNLSNSPRLKFKFIKSHYP